MNGQKSTWQALKERQMGESRTNSPDLRVLLLGSGELSADQMMAHLVGQADVSCQWCVNMEQLRGELGRGASAIGLHQRDLMPALIDALGEVVSLQPVWSHLPVMLFVEHMEHWPALRRLPQLGHVAVVDMQAPNAAVCVIQSAVQARQRQYQMRAELNRCEQTLAALRAQNMTLQQRNTERMSVAEQRAHQLRQVALQLTHAEHGERRRLAQFLHDQLQQLLYAAKLNIGVFRHRQNDDVDVTSLRQAEDLLDQSIESTRLLAMEMSPPVLHEAGLISALEWLAGWMEDKHGLQVDLDLAADAEPRSEEERLLLFFAVRELLFNVIKHAGVDQVHLSARVHEQMLHLIVEDEGCGFEPQDVVGGKSHQSTFGLSNVQQRLALLGGRMRIDSAPGRGSRIVIQAQAADGRGKSAGGSGSSQCSVAASRQIMSGDLARMQVLIADDHRIVREGLAGLLAEQPDIEVVGQACDGPSAVTMARSLRPAVIIMDVSMPGMDGVAATRQIVSEFPDIQVVALSMHNEKHVANAMREAGATAFLCKTDPPELLIQAVRHHHQSASRLARRPAMPMV